MQSLSGTDGDVIRFFRYWLVAVSWLHVHDLQVCRAVISTSSSYFSHLKTEENWVNSWVRLEYIVTHSFSTGSGRLSAERSPLYWRRLRFYAGHTHAYTHTHSQITQKLFHFCTRSLHRHSHAAWKPRAWTSATLNKPPDSITDLTTKTKHKFPKKKKKKEGGLNARTEIKMHTRRAEIRVWNKMLKKKKNTYHEFLSWSRQRSHDHPDQTTSHSRLVYFHSGHRSRD